MRVISGFLKGRKIEGYNIEGTRATMDRVKESLFAIIQNDIKDAIFLDLFAGSGNIGIEAISNGAKKCYFVDNNKKAIDIIQKNINNLKINSYSYVLNTDCFKAIKYFEENKIVFDIIYIDPPYIYKDLNKILNKLVRFNLVNQDSLVILEYNNFNLNDIEFFDVIRTKKYSNKFVTILKVKNNVK